MLIHKCWGRQKGFWRTLLVFLLDLRWWQTDAEHEALHIVFGNGIIGVQNGKKEIQGWRWVNTFTIMIKCSNWLCSKPTFLQSRSESGVGKNIGLISCALPFVWCKLIWIYQKMLLYIAIKGPCITTHYSRPTLCSFVSKLIIACVSLLTTDEATCFVIHVPIPPFFPAFTVNVFKMIHENFI